MCDILSKQNRSKIIDSVLLYGLECHTYPPSNIVQYHFAFVKVHDKGVDLGVI